MRNVKSEKLYNKILLILFIFVIFFGELSAKLTVNGTNNFVSYTNFFPGRETDSLFFLFYQWGNVQVLADDGSLASVIKVGTTNNAYMIDPPLVYPNPMRLADGAILGYGLSRSDMDLEFRLYDLFGNEVIRKDFQHGSNGGFLGYNRIPLDKAFFNNKNLPAGVYFYVFIFNDEVIGKGKFGVAP